MGRGTVDPVDKGQKDTGNVLERNAGTIVSATIRMKRPMSQVGKLHRESKVKSLQVRLGENGNQVQRIRMNRVDEDAEDAEDAED